MVRIRLRRVGARKQPSYRIVVADQKSARDGRFIENIGHYNPRTEPETVHYDEERALYWLSVGAQPSQAVQRLFNNFGTSTRLARLHQGEEIEALVAEALTEAEQREPVNPKTRREAVGTSKKKKAKAAAEAQAAAEESGDDGAETETPVEAEAVAEEEPAAEAKEETEATAETENEAEAEAEATAETEDQPEAEAEATAETEDQPEAAEDEAEADTESDDEKDAGASDDKEDTSDSDS